MCRAFPFILLVVTCAYAQRNPPVPTPSGQTLTENTPDTVVAVVNGRKFSVGDLERLIPSLSPNLQQLIRTKPKEALEQYAFGDLLAQEAASRKLDQKEPYKWQIENARRQVLVQAMMKDYAEHVDVPAEDARKHYESNLDSFRQAWVKMIFVGRAVIAQNLTTNSPADLPKPETLKAKAEEAAKLAREGKDFGELAKKYSDDPSTAKKGGVLGIPIRANLAMVPLEIRNALLKSEPGAIVGPLEHQTGWYIFQVDKIETPAFEAVEADIQKQMKDTALKTWLDQMRTKPAVEMANEPFWNTFIEANKTGTDAAKSGVAK